MMSKIHRDGPRVYCQGIPAQTHAVVFALEGHRAHYFAFIPNTSFFDWWREHLQPIYRILEIV